ncbi:MAG TPA: phytanoyl-CoA dioxygenase family protein [Rhizomicrobium sp.]|jgi:phytanoyl-CoA hydroxylase
MQTMYRTVDNIGREIEIPADATDDFAYFTADQTEEFSSYYRDNGYVVIRNAVPAHLCDAANAAFDRECYPSNSFIYRQTTARPERHVISPAGHVLNPILNVQSVDPRLYAGFRDAGLDVLTAPSVAKVGRALLGEPGKIVQSMYFQGNPATWPHQDAYYLDASRPGEMTAVWIANEDIAPGAGRFFVCPGSHKIDMAKNGGDFDIAYNHDRYKKLVVDVIQSHQLRFSAPALRKGDALFWAAYTIHGSLPTTQDQFSRRSFTAHFIPATTELLQFQARIRRMTYDSVNGTGVARPKDLSRMRNRLVLAAETKFPKTFAAAKKTAIKLVVR